jgi:hypothetical protein
LGPISAEKIAIFQKTHGLEPVDGIVGSLTWAKIIELSPFQEPKKTADTNAESDEPKAASSTEDITDEDKLWEDHKAVAVWAPSVTKRRYKLENGTIIQKNNGTKSWRNNNPGNMMTKAYGALKMDKQGYGIFPTVQAGYDAKVELLFDKKYSDRTLHDVFLKNEGKSDVYAPLGHGDNDPQAYYDFVVKTVGATNVQDEDGNDTRLMKDYPKATREKIVQAITQKEGYKKGDLKKEI